MEVFSGVNTREYPATFSILQKLLPSILKSRCFNEDNIPFFEEVRGTEIGHLFEHILLEYLCELKLLKGYSNVVFSGTTNWNWYREPRGIFHITIDCTDADWDIFPIALRKSVALLTLIMGSSKQQPTLPLS